MELLNKVRNFVQGTNEEEREFEKQRKDLERKAYLEEKMKLAPKIGKMKAEQEFMQQSKDVKSSKKPKGSGFSNVFAGLRNMGDNLATTNEDPFGFRAEEKKRRHSKNGKGNQQVQL